MDLKGVEMAVGLAVPRTVIFVNSKERTRHVISSS